MILRWSFLSDFNMFESAIHLTTDSALKSPIDIHPCCHSGCACAPIPPVAMPPPLLQ